MNEYLIEHSNAQDAVIDELRRSRRILVEEMLRSPAGESDLIRSAAVRVARLLDDIERSAKRHAPEEYAVSAIIEAADRYRSLNISRESFLETLKHVGGEQ